MRSRGYILIETRVGKTRQVANQLRAVTGITAADVVTGPYDIIAVVEAEDVNSIGTIVTTKVHTISGVARTLTCVALGSG